jgi:lipopolysaccharide transport system permease protein
MTGVIEGFRWALLGKTFFDPLYVALSAFIVLALLLSGIVWFKRMERTFADIV